MGVLCPQDVKPKEHRKPAWVLFGVLFIAFLIYFGFAIFLAFRGRHDPAVAISYKVEDTTLPDIAICPTMALDKPLPVKLGYFYAACLAPGLAAPILKKQFAEGPLQWKPNRTRDTTFTYLSDSKCEIEATDQIYPPGLCFVYKLSILTVPAADISAAIPDSVLLMLGWDYLNGLSRITLPLQRRAQLVVLDQSRGDYIGHQGSAAISTGSSWVEEGMITLTRKEKLGTKKEYKADLTFRPIPTNLKDGFPVNDTISVSFYLDPLGTQIIKEQDPVNPTVLLSQFFAGWNFVMVLFGLFFAFDITRYSVVHQLLQRNPKLPLSGKLETPPVLHQPVHPTQGRPGHHDLYPHGQY